MGKPAVRRYAGRSELGNVWNWGTFGTRECLELGNVWNWGTFGTRERGKWGRRKPGKFGKWERFWYTQKYSSSENWNQGRKALCFAPGCRLLAHQLLDPGAIVAVHVRAEHVATTVLGRVVDVRDLALERQDQVVAVIDQDELVQGGADELAFGAIRLGVEHLGGAGRNDGRLLERARHVVHPS